MGRFWAQCSALITHSSALITDLVYPRRCAGCHRFGDFFCADCRARLAPRLGCHCGCGRPLSGPGRCPSCQAQPLGVTILSPYLFEDPLRQAIHALKYQSQHRLAKPLGQLLAEFAISQGVTGDLIVPVPLHPARQRQRGFNQAERLARPLSGRLAIPIVAGLRRPQSGPAQVRTVSAEARRANVRDAFAPGDAPVAGQRVLLIDDVATTGATLAAGAAVLRRAGAQSVIGLTLARQI